MADESKHLDVTFDPRDLGLPFLSGPGETVGYLRAKLHDDTKAQLDRIEAMLKELLGKAS